MNGIKFLEQVPQYDGQARYVPMTGDPGNIDNLVKLGFRPDEVLEKPIEFTQLQALSQTNPTYNQIQERN